MRQVWRTGHGRALLESSRGLPLDRMSVEDFVQDEFEGNRAQLDARIEQASTPSFTIAIPRMAVSQDSQRKCQLDRSIE